MVGASTRTVVGDLQGGKEGVKCEGQIWGAKREEAGDEWVDGGVARIRNWC
jgi:hypothetical protein